MSTDKAKSCQPGEGKKDDSCENKNDSSQECQSAKNESQNCQQKKDKDSELESSGLLAEKASSGLKEDEDKKSEPEKNKQ